MIKIVTYQIYPILISYLHKLKLWCIDTVSSGHLVSEFWSPHFLQTFTKISTAKIEQQKVNIILKTLLDKGADSSYYVEAIRWTQKTQRGIILSTFCNMCAKDLLL